MAVPLLTYGYNNLTTDWVQTDIPTLLGNKTPLTYEPKVDTNPEIRTQTSNKIRQPTKNALIASPIAHNTHTRNTCNNMHKAHLNYTPNHLNTNPGPPSTMPNKRDIDRANSTTAQRVWESTTKEILRNTILQHGEPTPGTRAIVNHRVFANGKALNVYRFEHKNYVWVAEENLPGTFYIYATATPSKQYLDDSAKNSFMKNIYNTLHIPTYAATLNPQCIVAIATFAPISPTRQKELDQLVPRPNIHMEGKRPQTLEMTKVWPLPH
jgi:hypothetical protein